MKNFLIAVLAVTTVLFAGLFFTKPAVVVPPAQVSVGGTPGPDHTDYNQFLSGLGSSSFKVIGSKTSSSSPALVSPAVSGQIVVAAGSTTANASTTAVTSLGDRIFVQQRNSSSIAGTTCNSTTIASGTKVSLSIDTSTTTNSGFVLTVPAAPVTNPYCFDFFIVK